MQSQSRHSYTPFISHLGSKFPRLFNFCLREKINIEQLRILQTQHEHHFDDVCRMLNLSRSELALLKFYAFTPGFSLELLFSYDEYHIRDMAYEDEKLLFHEWSSKHQLTIPSTTLFRHTARIDSFQHLCKTSGIEYLNRKILSQPKADWQNQLNAIAHLSAARCEKDKEKILADCLTPRPQQKQGCLKGDDCSERKENFYHGLYEHWFYEYAPGSAYGLQIEKRYLEFKKREEYILKTHRIKRHSLFWNCVKTMAKKAEENKCDLSLHNNKIHDIVTDARILYKI